MNDPQSLTNHLLVVLREDVEGQKRKLALLERQEAAIHERQRSELEAVNEQLGEEINSEATRRTRRERLLQGFAELWNVPKSVITLRSIAERLGAGSESLLELRSELRVVTAEIVSKNRRVATLLGHHRRLVRDILETVLAVGDESPFRGGGTLIDAEA